MAKSFLIRRRGFQNSSNAKEGTRKEHEERWKGKETHGYLQKTLEQDETIDMKKTNRWLNLRLTAHVEDYVKAIQEQELNTKETQRRREKDIQKKQTMDTRCKVCDQKGESVFMPSTCTNLLSQKQITRILYQEMIKSNHLILIWYDMEIQTTPKVEKNKCDIVVWNKAEKKCTIVEITVPLDTNLHKAYKEKETK